jgi:hypothetical protein
VKRGLILPWMLKLEGSNWSDWARCQQSIGGIYFRRVWNAETLANSKQACNVKAGLESGVLFKHKYAGWTVHFSKRTKRTLLRVPRRCANITPAICPTP